MEKNNEIMVLKDASTYFYRQIETALARRNIEVLPETKVYLVGVAQDLVKISPAFYGSVTLAYGDSMQQINRGEKIRKLMEVGDRCLLLVGFFSDSITKRQGEGGLEYHVKLGSSAYLQVGFSIPGKQPLFYELAQRFIDLTKILSDVYVPAPRYPDHFEMEN